jgi:hypothetical protein
VSKRQHTTEAASQDALDLSHLRREARTALELAVVALAPEAIIDELAATAGLLEALVELPPNSAPAVALVPKLVKRTREALEAWQDWQAKHLVKGRA